MSHPAVHPVDAPPLHTSDNTVPRVQMKYLQGTGGTPGGLVLRVFQCLFAFGACLIMVTTSDFPSVSAFRFLVAASGLQILWSLSLAMLDIYAILVKRSYCNPRAVFLFAAGDGISSTLVFSAACASAGITVLIGNDLQTCSKNHCAQFETSTGMAFMTWFAALPSFLLNFWSLASR